MTDGQLGGSLEDLELDEVVRVIGLSRRSGILLVEGPWGRAEMVFVVGHIRSVRHSASTETVADVLLRAGVFHPHDLVSDPGRTVDDILRDKSRTAVDAATRADDALLEHMEKTVLDVFAYRQGTFRFSLTEPGPCPDRYPRDTTYIVAEGLDAEQTCERAKKRRGRGRHSLTKTPGREADQAPEILVVDDDPRFLDRCARALEGAGVPFQTLDDARQGLDALDALADNPRAVLILDLVMPRPNGRGLLGGLHLLRLASQQGVADRVYMAFDRAHDDAHSICLELGAAQVLKKPSGVQPIGLMFNPVLEHLGRPPLLAEPIDLVGELRQELGESATEWSADPDLDLDDAARGLEILKSLLAQVNNPTYEEEIPLLLLRFSSAFFSRGALFVPHEPDNKLIGLGGYGVGQADPGRTIHALHIPLAADTVFSRAMRENTGVRQPFFESEWNLRLTEALGGPRPREVYTAPLLSPRGVEAVLYADNALDDHPFPDITLLEIFLQQAGAALERSDLVREVRNLSQPPMDAR